jgi:PAS domain S-box-containing protein
VTVAPDLPLGEAITLLSNRSSLSCFCDSHFLTEEQSASLHSSCVIVTQADRPVGILTEWDVVRLSTQRYFAGHQPISQVMTTPVTTIPKTELEDIFSALQALRTHHIRHLPVVDATGHLLGVITYESLRQLLYPADLLRLHRASDVMETHVVQASPDTSLLAIANLMTTHRVSSVVVSEPLVDERSEGDANTEANQPEAIAPPLTRPIGIITERDVVQLKALELDFARVPVRGVMSAPVLTMEATQSLWTIQQTMQARRVSRVVITGDRGELQGLVTQSLLLQALNPSEIYKLAELLENQITELKEENLRLVRQQQEYLERQVQQRTQELQAQVAKEKLLGTVAHAIQSATNLPQDFPGILQTALHTLQNFLQCDRLLIGRWSTLQGEERVAEALAPTINPLPSIPFEVVRDFWPEEELSPHCELAIAPHPTAHPPSSTARQWLGHHHIQAQVALPIVVDHHLWGLLLVQHVHTQHDWQPIELDLLEQMVVQWAIALQQIQAEERSQAEWSERQYRERELQLLYTILQSIYAVDDFHAVLQITLHQICEFAQWSFGEVWLPKAHENCLYLSSAWYTNQPNLKAFRDSSSNLCFMPNQGIPGRVWQSKRPEWIHDVSTQSPDYFPRVDMAQRCGLKAAFGVPILAQREVVAVLVFFSLHSHPQDTTLIQLVTSVTLQLGQFIRRKQVEESLHHSELINRAIIDAIPDLLFRIDRNGRYLHIFPNQNTRMIVPPDTLEEPTVYDVLPFDLAQQKVNYVRRALETQSLQVYTHQVDVHGKRYDEELRLIPLNNTEVLVMIRDITEQQDALRDRQQAEDALRQLNQELEARVAERTAALKISEERWKLAFEGCNDSIWDWDFQAGTIFRSERWKTLRGLDDADIDNTVVEWAKGIHPDDYDRVMEAIAAHLARKTEFYQAEYRVRCKNGSYLWVLDRGQALWNEAGQPVRMVGAETDITLRKTVELELNKSKAHLAAAQRIARLGSWELDIIRQENTWSLETFELFGRDPSRGAPTYDEFQAYIHPDDRALVEAAVQAVFDGAPVFEMEYRIQREDGSIRYLLSRGQTMFEGDRPIRIIGTVIDITMRREAENQVRDLNEHLTLTNAELDRATRLKDEFLANMSHELRTPLNAILGMTEGLQEGIFGSLSDRQQQILQVIEQSGRHLLALINDILDLSKVEAGKFDLQLAPTSVQYLCDNSLLFVQQQALHKNIRLTADIPNHLPAIMVDELRIRQALINLLNNAVKFTPEGGAVQLIVRCESQAEPTMDSSAHNYLYLSVYDNGIGIHASDLQRLFQPFVQVDSRLNRQYMGTGLGLALVRRLVELHRGTVSVVSEPGKGSCFTICLPYHTELSHSEPSSEVTENLLLTDEQTQVLVIDDSCIASKQISRYLTEMGLQTSIYEQGEGALDEALRVQPDLIILDIQLPHISGWDILRRFKQHPATRDIPVIIFSVLDERSYGLELGAAEYLVKPINRDRLRSVLQRLHRPNTNHQQALIVAPPLPQSTQESALILLAEDNITNQATLINYLTERGYRLVTAQNGAEAIALALETLPDLIVMDVQMPVMDGLEAMNHIRQEPSLQAIPIIALTALAMVGDRDRCLAAGANDYLTKPVKLQELVERIRNLLRSRRTQNP